MQKTVGALFLLMSGGMAQAGDLVNLNPDELQALQAQGALVVDVRTPEEWRQTGLIPGSQGLTYFDANGGSDPAGWLKRLQPMRASPGQPLILVCRSGKRSAAVAKMLLDEAGYAKVYQLDQGVMGWTLASKPLERKCRAC